MHAAPVPSTLGPLTNPMVVLFHPSENTDYNSSLHLLQAAWLAEKADC